MLTLFPLAALITLALALVFVGSLIAGVVCCFIQRLRALAPFLLFVPSLTALGAGGGSWGLGYLANRASPMSALPFWGYAVGLLLGGALGFLLGVALAFLVNRKVKSPRKTPSLSG
jgi:hypothetical protein